MPTQQAIETHPVACGHVITPELVKAIRVRCSPSNEPYRYTVDRIDIRPHSYVRIFYTAHEDSTGKSWSHGYTTNAYELDAAARTL